jgi:hypothetical protein
VYAEANIFLNPKREGAVIMKRTITITLNVDPTEWRDCDPDRMYQDTAQDAINLVIDTLRVEVVPLDENAMVPLDENAMVPLDENAIISCEGLSSTASI